MRWHCSQLSKARQRNIYLMLFWSADSLVPCHNPCQISMPHWPWNKARVACFLCSPLNCTHGSTVPNTGTSQIPQVKKVLPFSQVFYEELSMLFHLSLVVDVVKETVSLAEVAPCWDLYLLLSKHWFNIQFSVLVRQTRTKWQDFQMKPFHLLFSFFFFFFNILWV